MIVDDSLTVRMDLGDAFDDAGFGVTLCASLAEARSALARSAPDLVVLDVLLPDGDGIDLLAELGAIPTILLSTEAAVADRIRGLERGASAYVGKPYERGAVVARARALMSAPSTREVVTVLVIDDSRTYREALADELRAGGYQVEVAESGEEGLIRAVEVHPDAIIVDGVMPGLDGIGVVRRLRLDPALQSTACLLLTGSEAAATEVSALDAGADGYLRKSESADVVMARLGAMLRAARESRGRPHVPHRAVVNRVLAVDDSATYLDALHDQLLRDGYEVLTARSGEQALALLAVERVDCVLLDVVMPGLSGTEVAARIKGSPLRNLPLILLTAHDDQRSMIAGINAGADDFVAKSADFEVLKARLRAQIRRKQYEDENRRVREELFRVDAGARSSRELAEARAELLERLEEKNGALEALNRELETFAYSVSHDLRQPLRSMDGFSQVLLERYTEGFDPEGRHYLTRIRAGAQRMGQLIDGLLVLSRVSRSELHPRELCLAEIGRRIGDRLRDAENDREVELVIPDALPARGDPQLVESVLENLLGNAWKFTQRRPRARIELGAEANHEGPVFYVRDDGAGFDPAYGHKLFGPFQRLHAEREFPGTGIGLATVQRIIHRHGGRIWAEGAPDRGAVFRFTLPGAR